MEKVLENLNMYHSKHGQLVKNSDVKAYICGGKGICTLENPISKNSYTYAFLAPRNPELFEKGVIFAYVKTGQKFLYLGMMEPDGRFHVTFASNFDKFSPQFKGAKYICDWAKSSTFHSRMNLYHEGVCACCGRKLTDASSIRIGIGPKCRKRLGIASEKKSRKQRPANQESQNSISDYRIDLDGQLTF